MKLEKIILLARHGATPYNDQDLLQGARDIPLSPKGMAQVERLAERLKEQAIDIIFHSPLERAFQTAEVINRHHHVPMNPIPSFTEMDMGEWEGDPFSQIMSTHHGIYEKWALDPEASLPGGESYGQVFRRIKPGVNEIIKSSHCHILVVAHAIVNRAFLGQVMDMPLAISRRFRMKNAALSRLELIKEKNSQYMAIEYWNDYSHLADLV